RHANGPSQSRHEPSIVCHSGARDIDRTGQAAVNVDEADRSDHIVDVHPAEALPPVRGRMTCPDPRPRRARSDAAIALMREPAAFELWPTDAEAGRYGEHIQRGPVAEHNGHTQGRPPGLRQIAGEE